MNWSHVPHDAFTVPLAGRNEYGDMSWAWERDIVEVLPRFPKARSHRRATGRHYLTKAEINALYFASHMMERPRGWKHPSPIGRYWRSALVVFFNYGFDTGTVWQSEAAHEPILWRHVTWQPECPNREIKQRSRWGWIFYRRVKTKKTFYLPLNRTVHAHLKSIMPEHLDSDAPVFHGGGARPNMRFRHLCELARIGPKKDLENGVEKDGESIPFTFSGLGRHRGIPRTGFKYTAP